MDQNAQPAASAEEAVKAPQVEPEQKPSSEVQDAPLGTAENPVLVPTGTEAKFKELADGGWKQEDVDAYLSSIEDEELRAKIKDGIDGKLHLAESDPEPLKNDEPFSVEELAELDPAVASRVTFLQEQLLAQMDEVEKARGELPEPMQRLLNDPVVKARLHEVSTGTPFVPQALSEEAIMAAAESFASENDVGSLKELLSNVVKAVPEVILQQQAEMIRQHEEALARQQEDHRVNTYLADGFSKLEGIKEFQSKEPALIRGQNGEELNPKHPGGAFALWLGESMKNDGLTIQLIDKMGGIEKLAYTWLANQKGGFGNIVQGAVQSAQDSLRAKLMRSRDASLRQAAAPTLNVTSSGVAKALLHGVDIDKAISDESYARSASRSLNPSQLSEVAKAMKQKLGLVNLK